MDQTTIARWLRLFIEPGQRTELRALGASYQVVSQLFQGDDLDAMAARAVELDARPGIKGVYFVPNPIRPECDKSAADLDILERRWLLIDIDPVRPSDTSSTDSEKQAAWNVLERCRGFLSADDMDDAIVADSGNGWHLCQPVHLPNDEEARQWCKELLHRLHRKCSDDKAHVDTTPYNAARIWKLPGTTARKGPNSADRPHRMARMLSQLEEAPQ